MTFEINNVVITPPSDIDVSYKDVIGTQITNSYGELITDVIRKRIELKVKWKFLKDIELNTILANTTATYFSVKFYNPLTQTDETKTFRINGNKNTSSYTQNSKDGKIWENLSFTLTEK